ncbi:RWD domain-containing protein 2A isoform X1 [Nomia melanderi]|uniref:RWD domain-containing protein 2A isoform X1 n=1 Tax=Nomia melanderi TaxID=2448451 RepID=UPI00130473EB|nr:RWD domain-containing protein 2A [Nomia melanderi]
MSIYKEISENFMAQIYELEALQSVYPKELRITDHGVLADINNFIKSPTEELPQRLEYSIDLPLNGMNDGTIELLVSLSNNYPKEKPEVYARSSLLHRTQQLLLNQALCDIVDHQEEGEPYIYTLISWLQDKGEDYIIASNAIQRKESNNGCKNEEQKSIIFARYWIYSHHIYNKFKRQEVINLAKENSLTGFSMAGKPGVICVEGAYEDCEYYWQKIKSMNWQKIVIRLLERQEDCQNIDSMRQFNDIKEIAFPTSERHNDLGQLLKYLTDLNLQHAFKELFGLEGKVSEIPDL